eukprot:15316837-Alexandrium_andersonii.AAC.1
MAHIAMGRADRLGARARSDARDGSDSEDSEFIARRFSGQDRSTQVRGSRPGRERDEWLQGLGR